MVTLQWEKIPRIQACKNNVNHVNKHAMLKCDIAFFLYACIEGNSTHFSILNESPPAEHFNWFSTIM